MTALPTGTARDVVRYDLGDGVATITLNQPERHNAWNLELEEQFFDLVDRADADPDVHVVVITGAGRSFCPGMDMSTLATFGDGAGVPARRRPMTHLATLRKLSIAAINGGCAGIGLVQAIMCDVRFAATEAKISTSFPRRGSPAEYGSSWMLPRLIGLANATDLLLSGRTISADEALRLSLVSRVVPRDDLMATVLDYARDVARNCAPLAIEAAKRQLAGDQFGSLEQSVNKARAIAHEPARRPDLAEGARSFLEKRPPRFTPLPPR